jgi:hypothetical protein
MAVSAFKIALVTETNFYIFWINIKVPRSLLDLIESFLSIDARTFNVSIANIVRTHVFNVPTISTSGCLYTL